MPPRPEKRRSILNAAYALLLRDGPSGLSMDALSAEARVSKPTIYAHFGSKAELCQTLVEDLAGELVHEIEARTGDDGPAADRVFSLAQACLAVMAEHRCVAVYRMLVAEGPRDPMLRSTLVDAALAPAEALIGDLLARLAGDGRVLDLDPERLNAAFFGLVKGAWLVPILSGVRPPLTEDERAALARLTADVMCGLAPPRVSDAGPIEADRE